MSGRGRGRGRGRRGGGGGGGRGQHPLPSGGRGQQSPGGSGYDAPPSSSLSVSATPFQPSLAEPAASSSSSSLSLSHEMEQKLTVQASSSTQAPQVPATEVVYPLPPPASSTAVRNPPRPGLGRLGQKMMVKANHFLVTVAVRDLNHYDVSISPEVSSKKVHRDVVNQLVKCYQASHLGKRMLAYDGSKSCYTARQLPFSSKDFVVNLVDNDGGARREREFNVSIKFASKADLDHLRKFLQGRQLDVPHETLQFLDVVFREKPSNSYEVIGRSFFHPQLGDTGELGSGIEYWKGFYQSLRTTQMGLSLYIDMSARAFFEPILVSEYVFKYFNRDLTRPLSDQDRVKVGKALIGVKVETCHLGHIEQHRISGITTEPAQQVMFSLDDSGARISVVQYFLQKYNTVLQYPFLPAVQAGSDTKANYLPMELCKIVGGQRYSKNLNHRQVTALLRATCQRPPDRQKSILQMVHHNNYNNDTLLNEEFGIQVMPNFAFIEARVLPPPMLRYHETGKESLVAPSLGQWNMIDKKMVNGGKVDFWACISFSRSHLDVNRFCNELIGMCLDKGMEFSQIPLVPTRSVHPSQIEEALFDIEADSSSKGKRLQLLIVILPDVGTIKRVCETELGIISQCCQPRQAMKYSRQYMENVALKINVKKEMEYKLINHEVSMLVHHLAQTKDLGYKGYTVESVEDLTRPFVSMYFGAAYMTWLSEYEGRERTLQFVVQAYLSGPQNVNIQETGPIWDRFEEVLSRYEQPEMESGSCTIM